jgi:hypothetical protein
MKPTARSAVASTEASTYQADPDQPLSEAVVVAVAAAADVDPLELAREFGPLYDAIDPAALDSLFRSDRETNGTVTFCYAGYEITADESGTVVVSS